MFALGALGILTDLCAIYRPKKPEKTGLRGKFFLSFILKKIFFEKYLS